MEILLTGAFLRKCVCFHLRAIIFNGTTSLLDGGPCRFGRSVSYLKLRSFSIRILDKIINREVKLMYEYKFVRIEFSRLSSKPKLNYQDLIKENAQQGWRFVQMVAPDLATSGIGVASYFELIFERAIED